MTAAAFSPNDVKAYYSKYFPCEDGTDWPLAWKFYSPDMKADKTIPVTAFKLLSQLTSSSKPLDEGWREWRFGDEHGNWPCTSPERFKDRLEQCQTGRYDAGAIRIGKNGETIADTNRQLDQGLTANMHAVHRQLVFDIDATDYGTFRTTECDCGMARKLCTKCSKMIAQVASGVVNMLHWHPLLMFDQVYCFYTGGRGFHIYVLDERSAFFTEQQRAEVLKIIVNGPKTHPQHFKTLPANTPILLDEGATKSPVHLLRGIFSIHPEKGAVCIPIENIADFDLQRDTVILSKLLARDEATKLRFHMAVELLKKIVKGLSSKPRVS